MRHVSNQINTVNTIDGITRITLVRSALVFTRALSTSMCAAFVEHIDAERRRFGFNRFAIVAWELRTSREKKQKLLLYFKGSRTIMLYFDRVKEAEQKVREWTRKPC